MATNDFLPFGGAAGANVMTQANYAALAARTAGFSSGTANSAQLNKVWRQASIIASVVAQFISDLSGQDAIDDGTTATLLSNLKSAVKAQSNAVVGQMRNLRMNVAAASASATLTADELILSTALGGPSYRLASFNKTINLATNGVGGMDTGGAPSGGYVAIYAIYNPTTGASGLLGWNTTSTAAPNVYAGSNMPPGYTASALVSAWPVNASGQFVIGLQRDRQVSIRPVLVLNTSTVQAGYTPLSISGAIPLVATSAKILLAALSSSASTVQTLSVATDASETAVQVLSSATVLAGNGVSCTGTIDLTTAQTLYWKSTSSGGTPNFSINVVSYGF